MIKEFALDPAVPAQSASDCRYFLEALRIENGRVLSAFPSKWKRMVHDAARELHWGKKELIRITECLRRLPKESLFFCDRPGGDPTMPWLERAVAEHERQFFTGIIALAARNGCDFVLSSEDIEASPLFQSEGQREIARTSEEIVGCVALLLKHAKTVKLIDPHFKASAKRWQRGLGKLIELVPRGAQIEIHRQDDGEHRGNLRNYFDGAVQRILTNDVVVKVFLHPKALMHNRYILTDQGGASYGTGLDDNEDGDAAAANDDVVLLREELRASKWSKYAGTEKPFLSFPEAV